MFFQTPGLDIAVVISALNVLVSLSFLLRMNEKNQPTPVQEKQVQKNCQKTATDEGQQIKATIQNQTPQQFNNDTDQANTQKVQVDHHPQSSALIFSPSSKNTENDNLFSTNRKSHKVSIVPMLQIQKPQLKTKTKSSSSQNVVHQSPAQQNEQNKSIIKQLDNSKQQPSFAVSKIVQCQQCQPDEGVEQSDDVVTLERKRDMSLPNVLQDDLEDQKNIQRLQKQLKKLEKEKFEENYGKFIAIQNYFLLFSCLFFVQFLMIRVNERTSIHSTTQTNDQLNQYFVIALLGAGYFNIFYGLLVFILERILKCNKIVIRSFLYIYNTALPFYISTTFQESGYLYNQEFIILLGCNFLLQFLFYILLKISGWKSYPLAIFWNF